MLRRRRRFAERLCRRRSSVECIRDGLTSRLQTDRTVVAACRRRRHMGAALRRRLPPPPPRHLLPPTATTAADAHTTYSAFCAHCAAPSGGGGVSRRIRHQRFPSFLEIHRIPKLVLFLFLLKLNKDDEIVFLCLESWFDTFCKLMVNSIQ